MEQSWQANPEIVAQAFSLLQALSNPMRPDHLTALTTLTQNVTQPMFVLHMLYIFAQGYQYEAQGLGVDMRQLAGFIIKNHVFPHLPQLTEDVQQLMKNAFLQALHDSIPDIRRTAAILIGRITESYPATFWIDMVFKMMEYIDAQYLVSQPSSLEGNLMALLLICEDAAHKLANATDVNGQSLRPLDTFVPKLVELLAQCHHQQPQLMALGHGEKMHALLNNVRMKALQCYNCLLYLLDTSSGSQTSPSTRSSIQGLRSRNTSMDSERLSSGRNSFANNSRNNSIHNNNSIMAAHQTALNISALILHMQSFMQLLSFFSRDENPEIRKTIVMSITIIAYFHISLLEPYFFSICEFMLSALYDPVDAVGIEACEFWHALLQSNDTKKAMTPFLSQLLPALIFRLKLSQEQLIYERILEEEESKGDKTVSFQPFRYRRRQRYCLNNNNNNNNANPKKNTSVSTSEESDSHNNSSHHNVHHHDDDLDNDHQQNAKDSSDASSTWTLRKQAALTLDTFAKAFPPQDILSICLPVIQAMLNIDQTNNNNSNGTSNNEKKELIPAHLLGPSGEVDMFLQEAGMLALGCLSQGCLSSFRMYMPQLVPLWLHYIDIATPETATQNAATPVNQLQVQKDCVPEMRAIVCWVMSRYIPLLEQEPNVDEEPWFTEEQAQQMYLSCFEKILHHVFDVFPRVQVAASSALSIFISHSFDVHVTTSEAPPSPSPGTPAMTRNVLQPYLPTIFQAIAHALETQSLGVKASLLLVDLLGVIAETFPASDIAQRQYVQLILPKVLQLYMRYDTNAVPLSERYMGVYGTHRAPSAFAYDVRLFPILESFTSLFSVWGQLMQEYLPFLFDRLMLMAWTTLETNMKQEYKQRMLYHSMVANSPVSPASPANTANAQQWPIYVMPDIQSFRTTTTAGSTSNTMNNNINSSNNNNNNPGFALNLAAIHSPRDLDTPFPSAQPSHRQDTDSDNEDDDEDEDDLDLETDDLQKDFTICALDCLSALLENLKQDFFMYVQETYPVLLHILGVVWQDYAQHYVRPFQSHTGFNATNANAGTGGSAVLSKTPSFLVFSPRDNTNMLNNNSTPTNSNAVINNSPINNNNNANTAFNFNHPNSNTNKNDKNIWKMRKSQYYLPELLQASFSVAGELVKSGFWVWSAMPQSVCQVAVSNASGVNANTPNNQVNSSKYTVETTTYFTSLLHSVVFHLDEQDYLDYPFLYNNAAWVLGELLLLLLGLGASSESSGPDSGLNPSHNNNNNSVTVERLRPFLPVLFPALAMAIQTGDLPDTVKSNLAVALGRLCLYFAYDMAELGVAEECFAAWCTVFHPFPPSVWAPHASSMGMIRNQVGNSIPVREKLQAFLGLLLLLRWYPELVTQNKTNCYAFCVALLTFEHDHSVIVDPHHPQNNVNSNNNNTNEAFQMLLHACVNEGHNPVPSVSLSHIVDTPYLWSLVLSNMYKTSSHAGVYATNVSLPHVHHDTSVPLIPLYVLWALIRGEVAQLLRVVMYSHGSDTGVSPVVPPPVSSSSPEMNKMWHRVAQSMKQQFDVSFLQRQFGAQF